MQKVPPFIPNSEDGIHCVNAVFRMIAKQYLDRDFTWEEIDALTRAVPGKATWTFVGETEFAKLGLKVKNIEPIDYEALHSRSFAYLKETVGPETYAYMYEKSNLDAVLHLIPEFLTHVEHETRRASIDEIISFVQSGSLVAAEVNSRILNDKPGLSLHMVLIYDFDGEHLLLHDPGPPALASRKVTVEQFEAAFSYSGANGEVTVFSK